MSLLYCIEHIEQWNSVCVCVSYLCAIVMGLDHVTLSTRHLTSSLCLSLCKHHLEIYHPLYIILVGVYVRS